MSDQTNSDSPNTRRAMLLKTALAVGSVPFLLRAREKEARADSAYTQDVINSLNFLLQMEFLCRNVYQQAEDIPGYIPESDRDVFSLLRQHEDGHVNVLEGLLGAAAIAEPAFDYSGGGQFNPFGNYASFLILSQGLEDLSVRAYKGQLTLLLGFPDTMANLSGIHSSEARHAARVRQIRGQSPWMSGPPADAPQLAPVYAGQGDGTFDLPLTQDEVMVFLSPFLA